MTETKNYLNDHHCAILNVELLQAENARLTKAKDILYKSTMHYALQKDGDIAEKAIVEYEALEGEK